jgi:O-antigen ligase
MIRDSALRSIPLALLLVWAPLPFGSVTPGFAHLLQGVTFVLLAALALRRRSVPAAALAVAAGCALIALLGLLQSIAWPIAFVEFVSPAHARIALENAELAGLPAPATAPLSLAPAASRLAALDWLLPAAALLAAALAGRRSAARRLLAAALVGGALLQVLLGARSWFAGASTIWGVETPLAALRLRGTFVNPNHLALFLEIALAVVWGALAGGLERARRERHLEARLVRLALPGLAAVALAGGLVFTGSRAGLLAAAAGAVAAGLAATLGRSRRRAAAAVAAALGVGLLTLALFGTRDGSLARLAGSASDDSSARARIEAARRTLDLAREFPRTGSGLGSFATAFPRVQGDLPATWRHAHNDWVEMAATTGVAGSLLLLLTLGLAVRGLGRARAGSRHGEERSAGIAAAGAFASVAVHSLFDFGLTIPANALALAVVAGAALAIGAPDAAPRAESEGS